MTPTGPWSRPAAPIDRGPPVRRVEGRLTKPFPVALALALVVLAACGKEPVEEALPEGLVLTPVEFADLPGWRDDLLDEALPALGRSCARILKRSDEASVGPGRLAGRVADWREACAALVAAQGAEQRADAAALRALIEARFAPFRAANRNGEPGLFTGYYEADLRAARAPDAAHRFPLYAPPPDRVLVDLEDFGFDDGSRKLVGRVEDGHLKPYFSRAEIEGGVLADRGLEILWADDPVDVFFLHVQGSGLARLPDGSAVRVGYAGSNGRGFTAIGGLLIESGAVPRGKMSMQAIRDWLRANPEQARETMQLNARYIFFHEIVGEGPIGAQGVALTAGRSLAVDSTYIAYGMPLWLDTTWPDSERPLRRLMVAQDTGSAIKGPVRGDFFWGTGEAALEQAGRMKQPGTYYLLLPKPVAERRGRTS